MKIRLCIICLVAFVSCKKTSNEPQLTSVQIHDRNGFQETISSPERLNRFRSVDFTTPQVYEKVIQTYKASGKARSVLTTYHDNGLLKQYLEAENGRAHGQFFEYYPSGQKKIEAIVIEGMADLAPEAQVNWVFDGVSKAWNNSGTLIAEIPYAKGHLTDSAVYYHDNGEVRHIMPHKEGKPHGIAKYYDDQGGLIAETQYAYGEKHGKNHSFGLPSYEEYYKNARLIEGVYYDRDNERVGVVADGEGTQVHFQDGKIASRHSIKNGVEHGEIETYDEREVRVATASIIDGVKHGKETIFYTDQTPKLEMNWYCGELKGQVKSWYPTGQLESQREMHDNIKHGHLFAWYLDGALMMAEEYEKGKLTRGKYFKRGSSIPISEVAEGKGLVHLFDEEGVLIDKVEYCDGVPKQI